MKLPGTQGISVLPDQMVRSGLNISGVWFHQLSGASFWETFSQNSGSAWIYSNIFSIHAKINYSVATAPGVKQVFEFFVAKWSKYFLLLMVMFPGGRWQASQKYARFYDLWPPRLWCARKASTQRKLSEFFLFSRVAHHLGTFRIQAEPYRISVYEW